MLEAAMIKLATAAVRTAAKLWLGDHAIASNVTASAVDILSSRLETLRDRRRLTRTMDNFADAVVERIAPIIDVEFRDVPENERLAALLALEDAFSKAALTDEDLFAADLDARRLDRTIRECTPHQTRDLADNAVSFYDLLLRECCGYVIEIARGLPTFGSTALTELLRRDTEILDAIREVLRRLPQRGPEAGFSYDYRQLIARTLDHAELFGITASDASRRYPLSVAYISLSAASNSGDAVAQSRRVEVLLARSQRLFIRGEAGLGKTTLLQWIAVRCALRDFPEAWSKWDDETIPFFLPLRRYAGRQLPTPSKFLDEIGRHIADEMPYNWVHERMRSGAGLLLIDGVDELPADQREDARKWLQELIGLFPKARYIVTSRPSATHPDWLAGQNFAVLDLQPMSLRDIEVFIQRWHRAVRVQCDDDQQRAELDEFQQSLLERIATRGHLRKLARYPLLCALLCALNRDRRAALPSNRMELYDVALQMLLERLDAERRIPTLDGVGRAEKLAILGDLAYWLIRNHASDADIGRVVARFEQRLASMPRITHSADAVFRHLLDRTGLLRKPVEDRVDFIHRTFQEYLAARTAVMDADDVGVLVENAATDQWHEVIVMAVGHASTSQRTELLQRLIDHGDAEKDKRETLHLLAMASLETAPQLDRELWDSIQQRAEQLVPPRSIDSAKSLANAGAFVLDMLASAKPADQDETVATIRAAAETGLPEAIHIIASYHGDPRLAVQQELLHNWSTFDYEDYAREVLFDLPLSHVSVDDAPMLAASRHIRSLRKVHCSNGSAIEAADVPDQVSVLQLDLITRVDLASLRGKALRELKIDSLSNRVNVDLSPLAESATLEGLHLGNVKFQTLNSVNGTCLRCLNLRSVSADDLKSEVPDWHLEELYLTRVASMADFRGVGLAKSIEILLIRDCANLSSLDGITQWQESLRSVVVIDCLDFDVDSPENVDILRQLSALQYLEVRTRRFVDIEQVRDQLAGVSVVINTI